MIYRRAIRVEFNHCDPAGIVFYPRYFEMTNSVCERFFREVAGHSCAAMMVAGEGVPTERMEADFHAHCGAHHRLTVAPTLFLVDGGRPKS
ncbi:hypothetical protein [Defluviimonas sp. WL0075]|uniref:Acyl-CoA thioesterase n=1 Tax=Albidovulum sediminicola TaxID=2984331 RepID=A0ABT2Z419_9RHOB|nr:hypothetical protein [Defluviimonas sp. WL0075]MCV2865872.1 hypothetical protein [Defluviimonas sp. WL0075]